MRTLPAIPEYSLVSDMDPFITEKLDLIIQQRRKNIKQECGTGENRIGVKLTPQAPISRQMQYEIK